MSRAIRTERRVRYPTAKAGGLQLSSPRVPAPAHQIFGREAPALRRGVTDTRLGPVAQALARVQSETGRSPSSQALAEATPA